MIEVALDRPWLTARLSGPCRMLSWAPHNPGFVMADRVVWREVRDADLTEELDALTWFSGLLGERGQSDAVGLLTSRDLGRYRLQNAAAEGVSATCLATVGLSNAERVGHRLPRRRPGHGTVNLLVVTDAGLTDAAIVELLSIVAEARTAAVMETGPILGTGRATGTGTDCIVVAATPGDGRHAGLHTAVGEAVGAAVHRAVAAGTAEWMAEEAG
jgi:adenosylcobinamide amidohydrolase